MNPRRKLYSDAFALDLELRSLPPRRMVFTNGVFDVLHPGHVDLLEFARNSGDLLVVGVNDDASVRRLDKIGDRPVFPLEERMELLAALACVDYLIPFSEDTPYELIRALSTVTVLVKGGDYRLEEMIGRELVLERGGELLRYPLREGYSTTTILHRVWKQKVPFDTV